MSKHLNPILTLDEVAAYLKVGKRTVYRLVAEGNIPAFKVGGSWRFRKAELEDWIANSISKITNTQDDENKE